MTTQELVSRVENAFLWMDRGLLPALDNVASALTKETGTKWTRNDVLDAMKSGGGK